MKSIRCLPTLGAMMRTAAATTSQHGASRNATSRDVARRHAMTIPIDSELVERPAPGAAPTAFRIWKYGQNDSDEGPVYFTERSAELLLAEQTARGRVYAFDFNHLSLTAGPPEAHRAAGWHVLEVRADAEGKPELWAASNEWCADAKAGLEAKPPQWRFFSPAFKTREGEVVSYINCALCINPLTHGLPSLASRTAFTRGQTIMTKEQAKALWAKMAAGEATDEEKAALAAFFDSDEEKKESKAEGGDDEKKDDAEEKKESKAHAAKGDAAREMATELAQANARLADLEIARMLDTRADLFGTDEKPTTIRKWAKTQSPENLKSYIASVPKKMAPPAEKPTQPGTAGTAPAPGLQGKELEEVNRAMGIRPAASLEPHRREDGTFVLPTVKPSEFRAHAARKAAAEKAAAGKAG